MRRLLTSLSIPVLLAAGAGGLWAVWAESEYAGRDSCSYGAHGAGHPVGAALAIIVAVTSVALFPASFGDQRRSVVRTVGATSVLAAIAIVIVAMFVGAGMRCMD